MNIFCKRSISHPVLHYMLSSLCFEYMQLRILYSVPLTNSKQPGLQNTSLNLEIAVAMEDDGNILDRGSKVLSVGT